MSVSWGDSFTLPLRGDRIMELRQPGKPRFTRSTRHASLSSRTADPTAPGGRAIDYRPATVFVSRVLKTAFSGSPFPNRPIFEWANPPCAGEFRRDKLTMRGSGAQTP